MSRVVVIVIRTTHRVRCIRTNDQPSWFKSLASETGRLRTIVTVVKVEGRRQYNSTVRCDVGIDIMCMQISWPVSPSSTSWLYVRCFVSRTWNFWNYTSCIMRSVFWVRWREQIFSSIILNFFMHLRKLFKIWRWVFWLSHTFLRSPALLGILVDRAARNMEGGVGLVYNWQYQAGRKTRKMSE